MDTFIFLKNSHLAAMLKISKWHCMTLITMTLTFPHYQIANSPVDTPNKLWPYFSFFKVPKLFYKIISAYYCRPLFEEEKNPLIKAVVFKTAGVKINWQDEVKDGGDVNNPHPPTPQEQGQHRGHCLLWACKPHLASVLVTCLSEKRQYDRLPL